MALVSINLTRLSEQDLIDLNRRIVERLRLIRSARQLVQLTRFTVGMQVKFVTDDGRIVRGAITTASQDGDCVLQPFGPLALQSSLLRAVTNFPEASPSTVQRVRSIGADREGH